MRSFGIQDGFQRVFTVSSLLGGLALIVSCSSAGAGGGSGSGGATGSGGAASGGSSGSGTGGKGSGGSGSGGAATGGSASGRSGTGGSGTGGAGTGGTGTGGSGSGGVGTGGSAAGGSGTGGNGNGGHPVGGSAAGGSGSGGAGGGVLTGACPSNAYFCSGFEDAGLPMGATYLSSNDNDDWTKGTMLDTTVFNTGKQSIKILKIGSYSMREFLVPAAPTFWFRVYLQTDVAIGGPSGTMHNLFLEAMWSSGQQDKGAEIVEEDCELGMNITDSRFGSNGTADQPGCPTADPKGTVLAENKWHCLEGYFDGTKGDFRLFADNQEVITQTGVAKAKQNYTGLRFGYRQYHERQRLVWYDDIVTAPQRIGCYP
ncbi:MAG TPA: hypothetical protein VGP07_17105 [Polyangia bacterium]|jgi:hypothetical protein